MYFMDIETRCSATLECGAMRYTQDPSLSILCAAFIDASITQAWLWDPKGLLRTPDLLWPPDSKLPRIPITLGLPDLTEATLVAHNAHQFDERVWARLGPTQPREWLDSMKHGRAHALPGGLDKIGNQLELGGKSPGKAAMLLLSKPLVTGGFLPLSENSLAPVAQYCLQDTLILAHAWRNAQLGELHAAEPYVILADRASNNRGIRFDAQLGQAIADMSAEFTAREQEEVALLTGGEVCGEGIQLTQNVKLLAWLQDRGLTLPNLRKTTVETACQPGRYRDATETIDPIVWPVLHARYGATRATVGKMVKAKAIMYEGRLFDMQAYWGAHTGRWAGREFNAYNLPRGVPLSMDLMEVAEEILAGRVPECSSPSGAPVRIHDILSSIVRLCLIPSEGKRFAVVDLAKIELAGVMWKAKDRGMLKLLEAGGDPYRQMASKIFGVAYEDVTSEQRNCGKVTILGSNYGLGPTGFGVYAAANHLDLASLNLTEHMVTNSYRDMCSSLAGVRTGGMQGETVFRKGGYLKAMGNAALLAAQGHASEKWRMSGAHLLLTLPSGREIVYRDTRVEEVVPGYCAILGLPEVPRPTLVYTHPQYGRVSTYGGRLVENEIQALCRDFLAYAKVQLEWVGLPVVLDVYDEVVVEIEDDSQLDEVAHILIARPNWAEGMPLGAEGFICDRYMKKPPKGQVEVTY